MASRLDPDGFSRSHKRSVYAFLSRMSRRLCEHASQFAQAEGVGVSFVVNERSLFEVVQSTYWDISRFKSFHLRAESGVKKRSDGVKRAAYTAKWILRFRPIMYRLTDDGPESEREDSWVQTLNEHFALEYALICLAADLTTPATVKLKNGFRDDLIYAFHYRDINADGLIALFKMLSDTLKAGTGSPLFETAQDFGGLVKSAPGR